MTSMISKEQSHTHEGVSNNNLCVIALLFQAHSDLQESLSCLTGTKNEERPQLNKMYQSSIQAQDNKEINIVSSHGQACESRL